MDTLLQDLRFALRQLRRAPVFTFVAVLTLALGIGANSAIFSVVNAVLLRPLPYRDPDRLVLLSERTPRFPLLSVSYLNYRDWRDQGTSFEAVGAVRNTAVTLTGDGEPERLPAQMATANLFALLGVQPAVGRFFSAEEDRKGAAGVALISYGLWQRRFAGSVHVLGQAVTFDNKPYTVIGVLPARFQVLTQAADVMVPIEPWAATLPDDRGWHPGILPMARLRSGVSLEQARAEMTTITTRLERQYPEFNNGVAANVNPMQAQLVDNVRRALLVLLGAVGFVLLIACANVANLLLARAAARQREVAIRTAVGATHARIMRQLLTESVLLSVAGAVLGLLLAKAAMAPMLRLGATSLPGIARVNLDLWVLAFTTAVALLAGIAFGLAPAMHTGQFDIRSALTETERGAVGHGAQRMRAALVVSEVALAMLLLAGAGLLVRSFDQLASVTPGFAVDHILIAELPGSPGTRPDSNQRMAFFDAVLERAAALPGVRSVGGASFLPVSGQGSVIHFNIQGRPPRTPHDYVMANYRVVSADYLQTLGVPLLAGRWAREADRDGAPGVVLINQTMARTYFPGQSPLGQHLQLGTTPSNDPWMEVIGVVGDVKNGLATEAPTEMYVPYRQANQVLPVFALTLVLRTSSEPLSMAGMLRKVIHDIDPNQPVVKVRTMEENLADSISQPRFRTLLLTIFAGIALALAAVGIYGVMAYAVAQRTREIGVRVALGSSRSAVFRLVIGQGIRLAVLGVAVGTAAALALTRYLSSLLFKVRASDPATLVTVAVVLIGVALLACYIPALRATRVDPMVALRYE